MTPQVSLPIAESSDGALLWVWVVPGSSRSEVAGVHGDALRVRLSSPPERGRANRELISLLERQVGASIELVAGRRSRRKRVLVTGMAADAVRQRLAPNVT